MAKDEYPKSLVDELTRLVEIHGADAVKAAIRDCGLRRTGTRAIDDAEALDRMADLLESGEARSAWQAALAVASSVPGNSIESTARRLLGKFKPKEAALRAEARDRRCRADDQPDDEILAQARQAYLEAAERLTPEARLDAVLRDVTEGLARDTLSPRDRARQIAEAITRPVYGIAISNPSDMAEVERLLDRLADHVRRFPRR